MIDLKFVELLILLLLQHLCRFAGIGLQGVVTRYPSMLSTFSDFYIFTSLRYDPLLSHENEKRHGFEHDSPCSPFYMLLYHRDRMMEAAKYFGWDAAVKKLADLESLVKKLVTKLQAYELGRHDRSVPPESLEGACFPGKDYSNSLKLPHQPLKVSVCDSQLNPNVTYFVRLAHERTPAKLFACLAPHLHRPH